MQRHAVPSRELCLAVNDLDFCCLPQVFGSEPTHVSELVCTVDCSRFFAHGGHHIVFAMDCEGEQGSGNPHSGPIERGGENLWSLARGVIVLGDGTVMAERWNGTASPVLAGISNSLQTRFDPALHPVFTLRMTAGYRAGAWSDTLQIEIRAGESPEGGMLFAGSMAGPPWGWDWSGSCKAALAGIALGFVPPSAPDGVELKVPRSAPGAVLQILRFQLLMRPPPATA